MSREYDIEDNRKKVLNGQCFENNIENILRYCVEEGYIRSYLKSPKYCAPGYSEIQFRPDFEITLNDSSICIVDATTTVRSDRIKQKQWDAMGVKSWFSANGKNILVLTVVPDKENLGTGGTRDYEHKIYLNLKNKIANKEIFSAIDNIFSTTEFFLYLTD